MITISEVAKHFNVHPDNMQILHKVSTNTTLYGFKYNTESGVRVYVTLREFDNYHGDKYLLYPDLFVNMNEFALGFIPDLIFSLADVDEEGLEEVDLGEIDRLAMRRLLWK